MATDKDLEHKQYDHGLAPDAPAYGETEPTKPNVFHRVWDSFKPYPNAEVKGVDSSEKHNVDLEAAAKNTAKSPLQRRLKGRHIQVSHCPFFSLSLSLNVKGLTNLQTR